MYRVFLANRHRLIVWQREPSPMPVQVAPRPRSVTPSPSRRAAASEVRPASRSLPMPPFNPFNCFIAQQSRTCSRSAPPTSGRPPSSRSSPRTCPSCSSLYPFLICHLVSDHNPVLNLTNPRLCCRANKEADSLENDWVASSVSSLARPLVEVRVPDSLELTWTCIVYPNRKC